MGRNLTCLAEGQVFETDQDVTGINANEIVVGPTRSGKTMSVVEPKLLHTYEGSLIVNLTKRTLVEKYSRIFEERGYEVLDLNLANPSEGNVAYDPLDFVHSESEVLKLARTLVGSEPSKTMQGSVDPYWNESGASALAAVIFLAKMNAEDAGKKCTFADFVDLYSVIDFDPNTNTAVSTIDYLFDEADRLHPHNQASRMWKTIRGNSNKTAGCIYSIMNSAVDKIMTKEVIEMTRGEKRVSFEDIATKKTVLFITTSPVNKAMSKLSNLFFTDAFRALFEFGEKSPGGVLPVPVHLICDDFATGSIIPDFHEYLSVFCAKRISVTLLLQSESQLESMYGKMEATTIINNCDTYLYLGGMDDTTCYNISKRLNVPIEEIYSLPLEQVVLFRRGSKAFRGRRYQTLKDPLYQEIEELCKQDELLRA